MSDASGPTVLEESLKRTAELATQLQQFTRTQDEYDRRLSRELKSHKDTKEKIKAIETDHRTHREAYDRERREHTTTKKALEEREWTNAKAQEDLKALADDLVSVRLQNEALRAEMEVQRKAFVVNVNWAARHAELKTKHEQLQQDYEKLHIAQASSKDALDAALRAQEEYMNSHRESVEELERVRAELAAQQEKLGAGATIPEDLQDQLAQLEELKKMIDVENERKKTNKEKARRQLEKTLMAGDIGLQGTIFNAWKTWQKKEVLQKSKKDQNTAVAMRGIANSNLAIQDFCLTAWAKIMQEKKRELLLANKRDLEDLGDTAKNGGVARARQKTLVQLEKQFVNQDNGLLREVIQSWCYVRHDRLRKEKAKAMAYRTVASGGHALLIQIYQGWANVWTEAKAAHEKKAANNARAMRMIANGDNALMDFCLTQWAQLTKQALMAKSSKEEGHTKALRMMANRGDALKAQIVQTWHSFVKKTKDKVKKMKAIERNLVSSAQQVVQMVFSTWKAWQEVEHKRKAGKINALTAAEKTIKSNSRQVLEGFFSAWLQFTDAEKIARVLEEIANTKGCVDLAALARSQAEVEKLRAEMEEEKAKATDITKRLETTEEQVGEKTQALHTSTMDLCRIKKELEDSRRKAREINEELAKVGQFLSQSHRREKSEKRDSKQERDSTQLPRIDGTSSRPRSGARNRSRDGSLDASKPATTPAVTNAKMAWE